MMERRLQFTLLLALNILILFAPTSGLFEATITSVNLMFTNDTSFVKSQGLKVKRVNRTHVIAGSVETFMDITDDYQVVSYFSKKSGDGYKRMPYKVGPNSYCKYFDEETYFVEALRANSNLPPKGTCPWPKNVYTIDNYEVNLENIPPVVPSGDYMLESFLMKDKKVVNGILVFAKLQHV